MTLSSVCESTPLQCVTTREASVRNRSRARLSFTWVSTWRPAVGNTKCEEIRAMPIIIQRSTPMCPAFIGNTGRSTARHGFLLRPSGGS
jgi:hypothetical protein